MTWQSIFVASPFLMIFALALPYGLGVGYAYLFRAPIRIAALTGAGMKTAWESHRVVGHR